MAQELSQERKSELAHANQLQVEVMKGLQSGEPVERLLLKALESLALKDNDTVSFPEAKKTLIAIYGDALGQPVPLQIELEEFETRLERLKQAYEEGKETEAASDAPSSILCPFHFPLVPRGMLPRHSPDN